MSLASSDALPQFRPSRTASLIREREILRIAATLDDSDGSRSAAAARDEVLKWVAKRSGTRLPMQAWRDFEFEQLAGGRTSVAIRVEDEHHKTWAVRADDPDKAVAQRTWTTEVAISYTETRRALFTLRLLVNSPERELQIQPAVPGLVSQIATKIGLSCGASSFLAAPWVVNSTDDFLSFLGYLSDPDRRLPVFVLTAPESPNGDFVPLIDHHNLSRVTIGVANVALLPPQYTWELTQRVGRRLSVFGGAVRVYMPGFSESDDPYLHRLFLSDEISMPSGATRVRAALQWLAANNSIGRIRLGRDILTFSELRELQLDHNRERLQLEGASDTQQLSAALQQIESLKESLAKAIDAQKWLSDEHSAIEHRARAAEAQLDNAGYRVQQLLTQLRSEGKSPDEGIALPTSWADFGEWSDSNLVGRVTLSSRARGEIRNPVFRNVAQAAKCLLWLANDYREQRIHGGGRDLRTAIFEGIRNDRIGADSFSFEWRGTNVPVDWHIKNGGNTRDPTRCLRIYYFWDEATQQVVIVSMPAHMHTGAT